MPDTDLKIKITVDGREGKVVFDNVNASVKKTSRSVNVLNKGLASIGTAAVAAFSVSALTNFAASTLDAADVIGKLADRTGFATDSIQELKFAGEQTGVSNETLTTSLERFNKRLGEAQQGAKAYNEVYKQLNVNLKDSQGNFRNVNDVFRDSVQAISELSNQTEQAAAISKLFGREGLALINTFKEGAAGLDEYASQLREVGGVIDEDLIRNAEAANDAMNLATKAAKGLGQSLILELAPALVSAAESAQEFIVTTKKEVEGIKALLSIFPEGLRYWGLLSDSTKENTENMKESDIQFARTNETIQKAVTYWQQQGVAQDVINQRVKEMVANFKGLNTVTEETTASLQSVAQKTELIAEGTVKVVENIGRIETTTEGILLTNKSMEQLAESTKKTVIETTKLPDNYRILGEEVNGIVTLTNKYQDATREAERTAAQNNETTQESIDKLRELASSLDVGSREYKKITKEIENMKRASERAKAINSDLTNDIKKIGASSKDLEKIRLDEDIDKRRTDIARTGNIEEIEKFEKNIGEFRKKSLTEIEKEFNDSQSRQEEVARSTTEKIAEEAKEDWKEAAREGVGAFERELAGEGGEGAKRKVTELAGFAKKSFVDAFVDSFQAVKSYQAQGGFRGVGAARTISQIQREDFAVFPTQGRIEALKKISRGELQAGESEIRDLIEQINQAVKSTPGGIPGVSALNVEKTLERVLAGSFGSTGVKTGLQAPNIQNFFNVQASDAASFLDKQTQQQIEGLQGKGV